MELREDPSSVFASDIVIESTNGPLDFDLSRVYTGKLEGEFKDFGQTFYVVTLSTIRIGSDEELLSALNF